MGSSLKSKNKIGYLSFGRDELAYGLAQCLARVGGYEKYLITPRTAHLVDHIMISCFWWEHVYLLAAFMRQSGLLKSKSRPRITIGGFNTFNPVPLLPYADGVVVGDGENVINTVLRRRNHPSLYKGDGPVLWNNVGRFETFGHETNGIYRMEIARGCKQHCAFCAVSHLKPYREIPAYKIEYNLERIAHRRASLFAPNPMEHSQAQEIQDIVEKNQTLRVDSDARSHHAWQFRRRVPRCGIEGISERLRKLVKKPRRNESLIEDLCKAATNGVRGIFLYYILDLPGESDEDWDDFKEFLETLGSRKEAKSLVLKPSPSVFMPTPHTPLEMSRIHWDRDYVLRWSSFFGRGKRRNWKIMMAERSRVLAPKTRILQMLATRAGGEFAEIEEKLSIDKIIAIRSGRVQCLDFKKLLSALEPYGGVDHYCGVPKEMPWKIVKFKEEEYDERKKH